LCFNFKSAIFIDLIYCTGVETYSDISSVELLSF
jgi:hypothetical protein